MKDPMNEKIILKVFISLVGSRVFFSFHDEIIRGMSRRTSRAMPYITPFMLNRNTGGLFLKSFIV